MQAQRITGRAIIHGWAECFAAPAILVRDLRKSYGDHRGGRAASTSRSRRGEVFGLLGPNGAGKTTTVEILEGYRDAHERDRLGARPRPRARARASCASASGSSCSAPGCTATSRVREALAHWARLLPAPARRRRGDRARRAEREGRRAHPHALGRPAAPARLRARADRRPRADLPRRADDRLRPGGAPRRPGDAIRSLQDLGKTVAADDALPRRGAGALRPRRDRQGRADPRRGRARRARRRRARATASPGATSDGELQEREVDDPTALLHQLTSAALARGERAARTCRVTRPTLEDVYLELTADAGEEARACLTPSRLAWRQYRLERRMFWRNPTRGVLQLRAAAAVPRAVRRDLQRRPGEPRRDRPGHRRHGDHGDDVQRAGDQHHLPARAGRAQAHARHAAAGAAPTSPAIVGNAVTNAAIQIAIVVVAGKLFFGIGWPKDWLELVVFVVAGVVVPRRRSASPART